MVLNNFSSIASSSPQHIKYKTTVIAYNYSPSPYYKLNSMNGSIINQLTTLHQSSIIIISLMMVTALLKVASTHD